MLRTVSATLTTVFLLAGCGQDTANQATERGPAAEPPEVTSKDFGEFVVHFSAMTTDLLQPEIARTYNIVRSKNRAMVNVSILRKENGSIGKPVNGQIDIVANNLTGQVKNLALRRIQENAAIYYIGDVQVAHAETLVFNLNVKPEGAEGTFPVRFTRQFFSD